MQYFLRYKLGIFIEPTPSGGGMYHYVVPVCQRMSGHGLSASTFFVPDGKKSRALLTLSERGFTKCGANL